MAASYEFSERPGSRSKLIRRPGGATPIRLIAAAVLLLTAMLLTGLIAGRTHSAAAASSKRPNILFIVTDDQRTGTIGFKDPNTSPDPALQTRWMESTAKLFFDQGTKFDNTFVVTPLCCPSRASIFTGRYPHNHRVRTNTPCNIYPPGTQSSTICSPPTGSDYPAFRDSTLQHYLKAVVKPSYTTGIVGKYLNKWPLTSPPPDFDRYAYWNNGSHSSSLPACPTGIDAQPEQGLNCVNEQGVRHPVSQYETSYAAQQAVNFIGSAKQPWFLYVAPTIPHGHYTPDTDPATHYDTRPVPTFNENPNSFYPVDPSMLDDSPQSKPFWVAQPYSPTGNPYRTSRDEIESETGIRNQQLRMLKSVDDMVGTIFTKLQQTGQDNGTLAVFISDNGYMWGEHWLNEKATAYTNSVGVPLMMRWPGNPQVLTGVPDSRLAANIDLAPTVMGVLGVTPNPPMDGKSLLGPNQRTRLLLERPAKNVSSPPPIWLSLRTSSYQYIESYTRQDIEDPLTTLLDDPNAREYYDLGMDRWERENKYASMKMAADIAAGLLAGDRNCTGQACP
jgi:arylsulfatase A-like enzyme